MKRRLTEAYDAMMMPDDCAQRIERRLEQQRKVQQRGWRNVEIYTPPRRNWWAMAASLVCLVLVLSAGGTLLVLNMSNPAAVKTPETAAPLPSAFETTAQITDASRNERAKAFLEKMCYYMPNWSTGYAPIDDDFWNEFLFASFTCPEITEGGKVLTVCGEAEFITVGQQEMVKISREAVADYVMLALGCELPENFQPNRVGLTYEDGYYYIAPSDFGSVEFKFRDWKLLEGGQDYAEVRFDVYADPENLTGIVTFLVWRAENENGFIIIDKVQKATDRQDIEAAVSLFSDAYFSGDTDTMGLLLADSFSGTAVAYSGGEKAVCIETVGLPDARQEKQLGDTVTVSNAYPIPENGDSYTYLTMELVKQDNGWKIQSYGLEK